MSGKIEYTSENGYRGVLYGKSSYAVFNRFGKKYSTQDSVE